MGGTSFQGEAATMRFSRALRNSSSAPSLGVWFSKLPIRTVSPFTSQAATRGRLSSRW